MGVSYSSGKMSLGITYLCDFSKLNVIFPGGNSEGNSYLMINNPVIRTVAAEPGWKSPPVSPPPPSEGIARWGRGVGGSPREALTLEGAHFLKGVLQSPAGSVGMAI